MLKRLLSLVLAALIAVPAPALPAQVAPPSIERPVAHAARDAAPALPRLAQRLSDTIPPLYMLGGDDKIAPVALWDAATDAFPSAILSHTRTSLATMFDSTGKLTYAPNNLLTYSNTFSNAAWTKIAATISNANAVDDPGGGTQASTVTTSAGSGGVYQAIAVPFARGTIPSIWVRRRTGAGGVYLYTPDGNTPTSLSVTGAWQKFYLAGLSASNFAYIRIELAVSGDAVDIYNGSLSAVTYETTPRTADQVITTSAAYYGPRIDYDPNTLAVKGLLIEEVRTNLALQSANMASSWSVSGVVRSTDATLASDGVTAAAKYTPNAGAGPVQIYPTVGRAGTSSVAYTVSVEVDGSSGAYPVLLLQFNANNWAAAIFNTTTNADGTATQTAGGSGSGTVNGTSQKYLGNGRYRLSMSATLLNSGTYYAMYTMAKATTGVTFNAGGMPTATFAGTEYIYMAFSQDEAGSFATSYIPTAASSITRAVDVVQFTGAALTALQGSAGSAITETISLSDTSPASITNLIRGTNSILYRDTTGKTGTTNGTTALLTAAAPTWNVSLRNGLAWSAAGRSLVYTSGAVATDANAVSNGGTLYLGSNNGSAVENGWYKSFAIYNQRLSDATLQAKSVVGASYAANDNGVRFAFANDNLPVHWRIAL